MASSRIELLPHQHNALTWAKTRSRIALFMEMRLGKTIVATKWVQHHGLKRVLLIAPWNTLVGTRNWEGHLRQEGERVTMLCNMERDDREGASQWAWSRRSLGPKDGVLFGTELSRSRATGWFLIHFEGLRVTPELLDQDWDAIIVDESTRIRNPQAQVTKLLVDTTAEYRAILSGLPNPESPLDFFTQFQFLLGHFMDYSGRAGYWIFRQTFFSQGGFSWQWWPKKGTREAIKEFVHANAFILTRAQAKIGSKKIPEMRSVAMGPKQERALREVAKKWAHGDQETKHAPVREMWMQRIAGGFAPTPPGAPPQQIDDGKIRLLHELLVEEFPRESVVVWFRFNAEIDAAYEFLTSRKRKHEQVTVERIHGDLGIPKSERPVIQDRFQDGKTRVLLMQVELGKFGWDLSRANVMMYYSNTYEFESRSQSEDRAIHPKKTDPVTIIDLVTIGTSDEDVVEALRDKKVDARRYTSAMASSVLARLQKFIRVNPGDTI